MGEIYIGGEWDYRLKMYGIYGTVAGNPAGAAIIDLVKKTKRDLNFVPRNAKDVFNSGKCNAETVAKKLLDQAPKGAGPGPATLYRGDKDNPATFEDERYDVVPFGVRGTGVGSDVDIHFDPDAYLKSGCDEGHGLTQAHMVLFHEMIHALRDMQGKANHVPTEDSDYTNEEEFIAIVCTNVYISAGGGSHFRADHQGHEFLKPPLNTSAGYLSNSDNLKLLTRFRLTWTESFMAMAGIPTPFNPFAELAKQLAYLGPVSN